MTALLELRNFCLTLETPDGPLDVLRDIDFSINKGEIVGVVGESGAGKSTLANAILMLLPPRAVARGSMLFNGRDLHALSPREQRALRGNGIAAVFQDPFTAFNPVIPIGKQLVEFQHWRRDLDEETRWRKAHDMLSRVGLTDPGTRMWQYPRQLSGGVRQRVGIAAALLTDPMLLIADEPTTALDATTEAQIIELLREVRLMVDGAIVFVTHDLGLVSSFCDRVAVMYAGELLEVAPVDSGFSALRHPYSQALLACDPSQMSPGDRHFPTIAGQVPDLRAPRKGCVFAPRCGMSDDDCRHQTPPLRQVAANGLIRCAKVAA
ncbi:ABC transporter ATP-binding protein [Novosphingobium album (ex Liu et al. 2023)]|uniref:ABC transporter ATP-binding protein n=1 Tax=Novosphingobium album (ex Liu et al. 2023) TaxID=3031130 RepID=A0ABT5WXJ4_9SPHN|nr:ABC transporter ATP-binding protein [Novosphingobium album (ex Liu et al. 2023)]MDE8654602.1 ABC transporter ATP-binding protein [Novosphingobium album (ex Liu et al. 2023)]